MLSKKIKYPVWYNNNYSCNRFSFRKAEFYNKADDESSNKKHFDLYFI